MPKQGGRAGASRGGRRFRDALVISQVALAMVLLVGAGLMIHSFLRLQRVGLGFDTENVLAIPLQLPQGEYAEEWRRVVFFHEVITRAESIPGVVSAGATAINPLSDRWNFTNDVTPEDRAAETSPSGFMQAAWRSVTPGFFRTMGIPLLQGRVFSEADRWDGLRLVVVSETLARRLWPGEDPIGKRLYWGGTDGTPRTVVGVVGDVQDFQVEAAPPPVLFLPHNQVPFPAMTLVVRTAGDVAGIAAAVRREIRAVNANLPIPAIQSLAQNRADAVVGPRFNMLLGLFAAVAAYLPARRATKVDPVVALRSE